MLKKLTVLLLAIILAEFNVIAQNPTRWRGPNSNGIYEETGLMKKWPSSGPEILWSFDSRQ